MNFEIKTDFNNILVFSHNDMDGIVAAYLIKYFYDNNLENSAWDRNVTVYNCDYNRQYNSLEWFKTKTVEFIKESKENNPNAKIIIYMLDYAIQPNEIMIKYYNWTKLQGIEFIWIDHHITAIQNLEHYNIPGVRDNSICGSLNTWKYLTKEEPPKFLQMVNDFDMWNKESEFSFDKQLIPLAYFVESLGLTMNDNTCDLISILKLLLEDNAELEKYVSTFGKSIYGYVEAQYEKNACHIYKANWMNYTCLVVNSTANGSEEFEHHPEVNDVDLLVRWNFDGKLYRYGVFSKKSDIDVGALCEQHLNGGGHEHCGGGAVDKMIFN